MLSRCWPRLLLPALTGALMYDVIAPHLVPPPGGCVPWADVGAAVNAYWADGVPPAGAGSFCAQQAKGVINATCGGLTDLSHAHTCPTSYCVAKDTNTITLCTSAHGTPEQVNVQIAGRDAVVALCSERQH